MLVEHVVRSIVWDYQFYMTDHLLVHVEVLSTLYCYVCFIIVVFTFIIMGHIDTYRITFNK